MYYLNPKRKFVAQNDIIEEMKRNGETVRNAEQPCENRPTRMHLFLPSTTETPDDDDDDDAHSDDNFSDRPNYRREMCEELGIDEVELDREISPLARLLSDSD